MKRPAAFSQNWWHPPLERLCVANIAFSGSSAQGGVWPIQADFDRYITAESWISHPVDLAHPARAHRRHDFVRPEASLAERLLYFPRSVIQFSTTVVGVIDSRAGVATSRNRWPSFVGR